LILANLGEMQKPRKRSSAPFGLEPDFCISEWAARIRQWRTGLLVDYRRKAGLKE
jgi:hypothetical protein